LSFLKKLIRKKKEEVKFAASQEIKKTELEEICGDDRETYNALKETMFLDPRKIGTTMEDAEKKAKEFEKSGDTPKATSWYKIAGGVAIHEGKVKKVKEYFGACQRLSGKEYLILKNPEEAVQKAQEYYQKYLKEEEKK